MATSSCILELNYSLDLIVILRAQNLPRIRQPLIRDRVLHLQIDAVRKDTIVVAAEHDIYCS